MSRAKPWRMSARCRSATWCIVPSDSAAVAIRLRDGYNEHRVGDRRSALRELLERVAAERRVAARNACAASEQGWAIAVAIGTPRGRVGGLLGVSGVMSFDLRNERGDQFRFSNSGWGFYLNLAEEYGWRPTGTVAPDGIDAAIAWPKTYDSSDGQWVSAEDAEDLAGALQRAIDDPARAEHSRAIAEARTTAVRAATGSGYEVRVEGDDTPFLREMIAFFRKGRFQIW